MGGQNVRLSWGRTPSNKQVIEFTEPCNSGFIWNQSLFLFTDCVAFYSQTPQDPNQWSAAAGGGYYGYPQGGYENYGYAAAPAGQDPNVYGSYPGYAGYQHPQQQQQQMGYS